MQVQVKTYQERVTKLEEIAEQLREEASSCSDATRLHSDLMDLQNLCSSGKNGLPSLWGPD